MLDRSELVRCSGFSKRLLEVMLKEGMSVLSQAKRCDISEHLCEVKLNVLLEIWKFTVVLLCSDIIYYDLLEYYSSIGQKYKLLHIFVSDKMCLCTALLLYNQNTICALILLNLNPNIWF